MSWGSVRVRERAPRHVGLVVRAGAARTARLVGHGLRGVEAYHWGVAQGCGMWGMLYGKVRVLRKSPRCDILVVRAGAACAARLTVRARFCVLLGLLLGAGRCARCVAAHGQLLDVGEVVEQAQRPICVTGLVGACILWRAR